LAQEAALLILRLALCTAVQRLSRGGMVTPDEAEQQVSKQHDL
jgi:hypothetical protein